MNNHAKQLLAAMILGGIFCGTGGVGVGMMLERYVLPDLRIISPAQAGLFNDDDRNLPVRMKLVSTQDSAGNYFYVWEDMQTPGVTCYKARKGIDCVYIPPSAK